MKANNSKTLHYATFERFHLLMTLEQARSASHQGQCDDDVAALARAPGIAAQLASLDPKAVASELKEYGAWDEAELADHDQNLQRILWLAACNVVEEDYENAKGD